MKYIMFCPETSVFFSWKLVEFNLEKQQSITDWVVHYPTGHPNITWFPERLWFNCGYFILVLNTKLLLQNMYLLER